MSVAIGEMKTERTISGTKASCGPLLVFLLLTFVTTASCAQRPSFQEMRDAQKFISELDAFVASEGRSPREMEARTILRNLELRGDENCRPCYSQQSGTTYNIYFGMSLGESYSFNSEKRTWR